jgi:hypothetical protein
MPLIRTQLVFDPAEPPICAVAPCRRVANQYGELMAFVRVAFFANGSADQYGAIARELAHAPVPSERHFFAAGPVEGGWQVVQVWASKAALDRFNMEWFFPALERLGDQGLQSRPDVRDFEAADAWIGTSRIE